MNEPDKLADWAGFRECYAADSPGLARIADTFEDAGFEFLSYGDLRVKGRQVGVLRFSDGLDRFAVFGCRGRPIHLARFSEAGQMIRLPILLPRPGENVWDAVVRTVFYERN
jgi:hypothetical protein